MMPDRAQMLLHGLGPEDRILEIGPSFNPVAPKSAGWRVTIVDHASQGELVAKYAGSNVDTSRIEPVDVVWQGGPLEEVIPVADHGRYNALIACHVVEHLPDLIGFLRSVERLLDPVDGRLLLAVPDKRFCFDVFRPVSTTGDMLAAHRARQGRHTAAHLFDQVAYGATWKKQAGWGREPLGTGLQLEHPLEQAKAVFDDSLSNGPYVDCHAWRFTPASFSLLILEFGELGLTDWRVEWSVPQPAVEFLVHLRRGRRRFNSAEAREAERLALLRQVLLELREQTDWLVDSPPVPKPSARLEAIDAKPPQITERNPPLPDPTARLDAIEARLAQIAEVTLPPIAASAAETRAALRPARGVWRRLLPLRRVVARLRGRV